MLKNPLLLVRLLTLASLLAVLLGAVGCASKSENNTLPDDYKKAPSMPARTTTP